MALELQINGLDTIKGRFFEDTAFDFKPEDLVAFEINFPYKEKLKTDTQEIDFSSSEGHESV